MVTRLGGTFVDVCFSVDFIFLHMAVTTSVMKASIMIPQKRKSRTVSWLSPKKLRSNGVPDVPPFTSNVASSLVLSAYFGSPLNNALILIVPVLSGWKFIEAMPCRFVVAEPMPVQSSSLKIW